MTKEAKKHLARMQYEFREAMAQLYGKPMPNGQLRDLVWTFTMGWIASQMFAGQRERRNEWIDIGEEIKSPAWVPDDNWKWWIRQ